MLTRLGMIEEIRDAIEALYAQHRFEAVREVMDGYDRFNFAGVSEREIHSLWLALKGLLLSRE